MLLLVLKFLAFGFPRFVFTNFISGWQINIGSFQTKDCPLTLHYNFIIHFNHLSNQNY